MENHPGGILNRANTHSKHRPMHQPAKWTSEFPPELIAAAAEEEAYLASSNSDSNSASSVGPGVAAPNIPPAPVLPRHLDKLILNARKEESRSGGSSSSSRSAAREKEREERRQGRKGRSMLGMTSTTPTSANPHPSTPSAPHPSPERMPVMSPNGFTEASRKKSSVLTAGMNGLSDDTSVLPVPSHVVLHHLSTSAIRNGVLAVGNTTRYRKKVSWLETWWFCPWFTDFSLQYLTTIYYKPT